MDKELKETVKSLAESVKAMQAKMSTLKSENSNSLASSQRSDLVPGIPPVVKRRETTLEGDDIEPIIDDEAEDEDDENGKP